MLIMVNLVSPLYVVLIMLACSAARLLLKKRLKLPPGPPGLPVLGNALQIPTTQAWKTFADWGKLYGPVAFAEVLGRPMIIVNSITVARDLMERKGASFSDRPEIPVLEMIGWGVTLPLLQYGSAQQRKQRRLMQEYLGPSAIRSFDCVLEKRVRKFLERLLVSPDDFHKDSLGHVASIILEAVYGHEVSCKPSDDPLIRVNEEAAKLIVATGNIGSTIIDLFPFLRHLPAWLPGMGLKRKILQARDAFSLAFTLPFEEAKSRKDSGAANPALLYKVSDKYKTTSDFNSQEEEDIKTFSGTFYLSGTETVCLINRLQYARFLSNAFIETATALTAFFLMMVHNQEVQKRAQEEIDRTIGLDRLPLLNDRASLPFIDCLIKEVLRIHPPAPLGLPHQSTPRDEHCRWDIPGKSMVIPNIWHMMKDEEIFIDPEKFNPDRHLTRSGGKRSDDTTLHDPVASVFGFGRRVCPGRAFAESVMWITMANVLAAFDITPWRDPFTGEEVLPIAECESDIVNAIKPFKCRIVPRKGRVVQIVRDN
ncbi:hypothetical protein ACEPAH_7359 [Sanghuangporus vaninii]